MTLEALVAMKPVAIKPIASLPSRQKEEKNVEPVVFFPECKRLRRTLHVYGHTPSVIRLRCSVTSHSFDRVLLSKPKDPIAFLIAQIRKVGDSFDLALERVAIPLADQVSPGA